VIPAGAELLGNVTKISPAKREKKHNAELGGDFTPQHEATIEFDQLVLPSGDSVPLHGTTVGAGVTVVRFVALGSTVRRPSLTKKLWEELVGRERQAVRTFTAPNKVERARRMLYSELPYHPEQLLSGTQYSVELSRSANIPSVNDAARITDRKGIDSTLQIVALLQDEITSKQAIPGTAVHAIVSEPLFDANHQLRVPQGSVLTGEITQVKPAGKWGKGGTLRFSFRELKYPTGFSQRVHGAPTAVDASQESNFQLDSEGGVKPGPKGVAAPLVMGLLAASALHEDEGSVMHTGGASNGFALIGRVAALASKSTYVGAAFGFYGMGRALYPRFIAHGKDVDFPTNTRIEVVLSADPANPLELK